MSSQLYFCQAYELVLFLLYAAAAAWLYRGEHYNVGENDQQTGRLSLARALFGLLNMVSSVNFPFPFKLIPPWVPRFGWHPTLCFVRQVKDVEIHPIHGGTDQFNLSEPIQISKGESLNIHHKISLLDHASTKHVRRDMCHI